MSLIGIKEKIPTLKQDANVYAFLQMIRYCEGTLRPDGYNLLFGYKTFKSYADHPRITQYYTNLKGERKPTSAAGAYQILKGSWDEGAKAIGLTDFTPNSQDKWAIWRIGYRKGLTYVVNGQFKKALSACAKEWASLPTSQEHQPKKTYAEAKAIYLKYGGKITE